MNHSQNKLTLWMLAFCLMLPAIDRARSWRMPKRRPTPPRYGDTASTKKSKRKAKKKAAADDKAATADKSAAQHERPSRPSERPINAFGSRR